MKFKSRLIARIPEFLLLGLAASSLTACQGSNLGSSLEVAIAPASPSPSTEIPKPSAQPNPTLAATATPTTTSKPTPNPTNLTIPSLPTGAPDKVDRLSSQIPAIALQSISAINTKPITKISLKTLFYINFTNPSTPTKESKELKESKEFSDLETAPTSLRSWIKDLYQLGTITPKTGQEFKPNLLVARREYARWLLETNNRLYKNQPSRQIRLAQRSDAPSFPDIPNTHPDFAIIQGLANAGLINGTGDRFRPNDPLLREELVQWKIPLDLRQPLPSATWESIGQTWGFKDSDRISESALGAIFADAQLRDLANIRRSFGFTTILQPQKPVTRAEAAASLWYFGTATDGISASKVLELER